MAGRIRSPWQTAGDPDTDRASKKEAVLRAAAQVFNEKGFQATTLDEVAARLNVSKPTLYYYVRSKDDILFECVQAGLTLVQEAIAAVEAKGGRAVDKLMAAMRQYVEIVTMDFGMCIIRVGEDPLPKAERAKLRRMKAEIDHEFRRLIEEGMAEGSIAPCDARIAAFTIGGALSWIGRWYRPDGAYSREDIADHMIALMAKGLCSRDPKFADVGCKTPRTAPAKPRAARSKAATQEFK